MLPTQRCPLCGLRGDNRGTYQTALQLHTHTVTPVNFYEGFETLYCFSQVDGLIYNMTYNMRAEVYINLDRYSTTGNNGALINHTNPKEKNMP